MAVVTVKPYQKANPLINGSLAIDGDYAVFEGLHIKDLDFINRLSLFPGQPKDIPSKDAIRVNASHIELRDCVIENCRQGVYKNSVTKRLVIDGCVIFHNGWDAPDRAHGHGVYLAGQLAIIKNSIMHTNFAFGAKAYDEGKIRPPINDIAFEDNIAFNNFVIGGQVGTRGDFLYGHNDLSFHRPIWRHNYTYQLPAYAPPTGANTNHFGYKKSFFDAIVVDNYFPNGLEINDSEAWGSTFLEYSGNVTAPEATNRVVLIPVRGRLNCAIYNWELLTSVAVDLSAYWSPGDTVLMTQVTDYFVDIDTQVIAGDGTIMVDMQAISHTVQTPQGMSAPATLFPEFGSFVLEKI